jgi:hypothetical protein
VSSVAEETPVTAGPAERASGQRRIVGGARIAAGALILAAMITQVTELVLNGEFVPSEYFAYFTIESSLINIVVLLVGGVLAARWLRDPELYTAVRMSTVAYALVTAAVYNVLLRGLPPTGFVGVQWPNEVMHVWIPVFIALDWLLSPGRAKLGWKRLWLVVSFPIAWCAFTLIRGAIDGWYPYPFINPTGDGGYPSVFVYIAALSALMVGLGAACIAISRFGARKRA